MEIVRLNRSSLKHEYGLDTQRLQPWAVLNAPFEGSWCVVAARTSSTPHCHHEYEIFIAVRGEAVVACDGDRSPFRAGDVVYFQPGVIHYVINENDDNFEFYSVWWDGEMSDRFVSQHRAVAQP
jgi:mannose-6-phosphate isomerase-like protein (cupin superfamily)